MQIYGTPEEPESMMAVPLRKGSQKFGLVSVSRIGVENPYNEDDLALFTSFANIAGSVLDNATIMEACLHDRGIVEHRAGDVRERRKEGEVVFVVRILDADAADGDETELLTALAQRNSHHRFGLFGRPVDLHGAWVQQYVLDEFGSVTVEDLA